MTLSTGLTLPENAEELQYATSEATEAADRDCRISISSRYIQLVSGSFLD